MQKNTTEILQEILKGKIGERLNQLENSYLKHSANIDNCFNNIEYMKSKINF